eukprot:3327748-Alexandrium_andersonii.AAC.1
MCIRDRPHARRALAAPAELRCPDGGRADPRNDTISNAGEAIVAGGVRARVPVAAAGTLGLRMCSERLAHARWG